jgi:hypothetical protein
MGERVSATVFKANYSGISRLLIASEGLLLLTELSKANQEIQKIVAFEGAFEKLFSVIAAEGGAEGGIVVQDSINLMNALLRGNVSNQVACLKYSACAFIHRKICRTTSGRQVVFSACLSS